MWIESRHGSHDGHANGVPREEALTHAHRAPLLGEPFYLWSSIVALGAICRSRGDAACLKTAAKLALAVSAAYAVARSAAILSGRAASRSEGSFFEGHRAAAWAAAGVVEREQGGGAAVAAYSAAALSGFARRSGRRGAFLDQLAGAVLGRLVSRMVARL